MHVADADAAAVHFGETFFRNAHAVVFDFNQQAAVRLPRAHVDLPAFHFRREAVLDGIFHHRLQQHAGHKCFERGGIDLFENLQLVSSEADHFDVEIIVNEIDLFAQRHERFMFAQQPAEDVRKFQHDAARHVRIKANQRRDGIQRVEEEVRIDLAGERVHARAEQQLLILLEVHLDAGVVPDLDGHRDAHERGQHHEHRVPPRRRVIREQPARRNDLSEFDLYDVEEGADQQRQHGPVSFCVADAAPHPAGDAEKKERAKVPDVFFFGHRFADDSGEQADQRGGGTGNPFVVAKGGQADQRAAEQTDDASANQAEQKRAFEGEVEKFVADQAQQHADGEWRREEQQQHYFLVGVADFGEEQFAEGIKTNQQRGERGREADFQNQDEDEVLSAAECAHSSSCCAKMRGGLYVSQSGRRCKGWAKRAEPQYPFIEHLAAVPQNFRESQNPEGGMSQYKLEVVVALVSLLGAGTVASQEVKIRRSELPAAVERTVAAASQDGKVTQITKEKEKGETVYEAEILKDGHVKTIEMNDQGSILEIEEEVALENLAPQIKAGLEAKAGAAKIVKVESVTKGGNVVAYEADVSLNGKRSEIKVDANGK